MHRRKKVDEKSCETFLLSDEICARFNDCIGFVFIFLKKNLNAPRPSEHPPVRGEKCQNV